jgi:hypothetical protein
VPVTPAKAGVQEDSVSAFIGGAWIPASAGMTDNFFKKSLKVDFFLVCFSSIAG